MNRAITANRMRPVVDRIFAFGEARDALNALEKGSPFREDRNPGCCLNPGNSQDGYGYLIETAGLPKGQ